MMIRCAVTLILLLLLAGPGSAISLEVWLTGHNHEELRILEELTERDFTARTGIHIDYSIISWADSEQRFLMAAAADESPDVGGVGLLFAPELGLRGATMDLRRFPDYPEVIRSFYPNYLRSLQFQGLTFGLPYQSFLYLGFQRTDILEELGLAPLETWAELRQILPRLQARGMNSALTFGLADGVYADVNMFIWQHGGDDYTPDLKSSGYTSPEALAGFTEFAQLYTEYGIVREAIPFQGFTSGSLPILLQSASFYTSLELSAPQIRGRWQMTPALGTPSGEGINRATFIGGAALTISQKTKNANKSWEFLKWLTSQEVQGELARRVREQIPGSFFIPANREAIGSMAMGTGDTQTLITQAEGSLTSIYGLVAPRHRRRYLQFAAQEAVTLGVDPKEALARAAREHNEEIRRKTLEYDRFIRRLLER